MTTLNGWALSSWYGIDHTYVTSSDGYVWNCWGRSSGGKVICGGKGSSRLANCISQRKSQAGLIYGITGVCHQTANRILYPAGSIVSGAKNYWITSFLYGTYGRSNFLNKLKLCSNIYDIDSNLRSVETGNSSERDYLLEIQSLYLARSSKRQESFPGEELKITLNYRLGSALNSRITKVLVSRQNDLLREKKSFDKAFLNKYLSPDQYAAEINDLVKSTLISAKESLGNINYQRLFGLDPQDSYYAIDPEIMANAFRNR